MNKIDDIVSSEVSNYINERKHQQRQNDFHRLNELFSNENINENSNERDNVIALIKNNQWEKQDPSSFRNSLSKSKHILMLTDYTESELDSMKLFKLKGYNIGYALKNHEGSPYSEIVAVHNNEPTITGIGNILMQSAINNGGCYLDHYDGFLSDFYSSLGFEEYDRYEFDPQYDPDGEFEKKYGRQDIIFRKHKNCQFNFFFVNLCYG